MRDYVVEQLRDKVIPALEKVSGQGATTRTGCGRCWRARPGPRTTWCAVLESAKHRPSPIDAYFGGVYYIGPIFTAFRGTEDAVDYYRTLRAEVRGAHRAGLGPVTPDGEMGEERFRLVVEGPPNWTSFREFWKMFADEGAVVVASTYTKVGGVYDIGFRHDPDAAAGDPRRLLPGLLHQPEPARRGSTCSVTLRRGVRRPTAC